VAVFTGIVEEVGRVVHLERDGDRARLRISCGAVLGDATPGASISVDGCCLTVSDLSPDGFVADLMGETLRATALGSRGAGDEVNLERPLRADGRFGGHLVQGHVDAVGEVVRREDAPGQVTLTVTAPTGVARYLVPKGSITIQGVSLTVVDVDDGAEPTTFRVGLIPHTTEVTTLGSLGEGDRVNLEADVVAKYVERFLGGEADRA
jgi:riboflavin synthase